MDSVEGRDSDSYLTPFFSLISVTDSISYLAMAMAVSARSASNMAPLIEFSFQTLNGFSPVTRFKECIRCSTVARERYFLGASYAVNCTDDSSLKIPERGPMTSSIRPWISFSSS